MGDPGEMDDGGEVGVDGAEEPPTPGGHHLVQERRLCAGKGQIGSAT